jgi:outer membrane protein assembly factor BamB
LHELGFNDEIFIATTTTGVIGLDRANGAVRWEVDLPATPISPATGSNVSFFVNLSNGRLSAYLLPDAPDYIEGKWAARVGDQVGEVQRASKVTAPTTSVPKATSDRVGVSPATGGRTVTISTTLDNRSATKAIQAAGGRTPIGGVDIKKRFKQLRSANEPLLFWDFHTTKRVYERPVVGSRNIMVVSSDNTVFFVDRLDITKTAELSIIAPVSAPVGQYGDLAYVADRDGDVYAVDLQRRFFQWRYTANSSISTMPQATDSDLYVVADLGGLIRLDREPGHFVWQNPEATRFLAANPKFVYAADRLGQMLVLDRRTGARLGRLDTSRFVVPVRNETTDRVLLAAHDGTIVCLHDHSFPRPVAMQSAGAKVAVPIVDAPATPVKTERPLPSGPASKPATPEAPGTPPNPATPNPK